MEKYQITKTIRFKLEAIKAPELEEQVTKLADIKDAEASLANLITIGKDLSNLLKNYIYTDKQRLKKTVIVHWRWLREFTKDKYFEWKNTNPVDEIKDTNKVRKEEKAIPALGSMASQLKGFLPEKKKEERRENKHLANKEKRFKLSDVAYLNEVFEEFLKNWNELLQNLAIEVNKEKHSSTRKAELGKLIHKIGTREYLLFLEKFIIESKDKDDPYLESQLKEKLQNFRDNLLKAEQWTLPAQSSGIELAKASFNYYTINKKEKDFTDERKDIERQLHESKPIYKEKEFFEELGIIKIEKDNSKFDDAKPYSKENKPIDKYIFLYELTEQGLFQETITGKEVTLDLLYKILKNYKAIQKKKFKDTMDKNPTYEDLIKALKLFSPKDTKNHEDNLKAFNKYKEITSDIQKLGEDIKRTKNDTQHYRTLKEESRKLRQQRGKLFFHTGLRTGKRIRKGNKEEDEILAFEKYKKFCNVYKIIAQERGRLIARLKGIEKEKIDSQRLKYWSFLVETENQHELILVPKVKAQLAYQKISALGENNTDSTTVYYFESLTYRALRKLCFKVQDNTFQEGILNDKLIQKSWNKYFNDYFEKIPKSDKRIGEHIFKNEKDERDENKLIAFYKDVLQSDYVQKNREDGKIVLPLNFEEEVLKPDFSSKPNPEQAFKTALEKCCYLRKRVFPKTELAKILSECNAQRFAITSYDLRKKDKSNLKAHTKLWFQFWNVDNEQQNFPLRLNPEIKILWREPKATRVEKYGEGTELYDEKKKNRYLKPQYTLTTSFLQNALLKEINYSFDDLKQKEQKIKNFNGEIKKHLKKQENLWFYGIDTGIVELASLCLIKKDGTPQMFPVLSLREEKLNYEKTGFFKDKITTKQYKAIQNLSYFLNEELYRRTFDDDKFQEVFEEIFGKKEVCALDLSSAKLISGYIVSNGDIHARLNVALSNARRKMVEAFISNSSLSLTEENYIIKMGEIEIFKGRLEFNSIKSWETIQTLLKDCYEKDKDNLARVQEDISRYKNGIAANITGILSFLYKKYPGIVTIEYLDQNEIESHRNQFGGIVDNPVEKSLYRKFQTEGLVPPISELWSIKDKNSQFGIVYFADSKDEKKGAHGLRCPNCNKKAYNSANDPEYIGDKKKNIKGDKEKKIFKCKHCGYHNKEKPMGLQGLDSNDKVAAYNIAKRGLEILN